MENSDKEALYSALYMYNVWKTTTKKLCMRNVKKHLYIHYICEVHDFFYKKPHFLISIGVAYFFCKISILELLSQLKLETMKLLIDSPFLFHYKYMSQYTISTFSLYRKLTHLKMLLPNA